MEHDIKQHLHDAREFYDSGEYAKAELHLLEVMRHHDGFADVHNMLGFIRFQRGEPELARRSFEKALELNPRYTEAALNLSVCYNELGRYQDAKEVYSRASTGVSREPSSMEKLDGFIRGKIANLHADVAVAYTAAGMVRMAIREYRQALELAPTFVDIRLKLANSLRDAGDLDEALDELTALKDQRPDYVAARVSLGLTYWKQGQLDRARDEWQAALDQDPDNASARLYLKMAAPEG